MFPTRFTFPFEIIKILSVLKFYELNVQEVNDWYRLTKLWENSMSTVTKSNNSKKQNIRHRDGEMIYSDKTSVLVFGKVVCYEKSRKLDESIVVKDFKFSHWVKSEIDLKNMYE